MRKLIQPQNRPPQSPRNAFTLLEVLLATAILALALTAVSQLATNGTRAANRVQRETQAAIICQSTLDEILAGIRETGNTRPTDDERWSITTRTTDGPTPTLKRVSVEVTSTTSGEPTTYELTRLVPQPDDLQVALEAP